MENDTEITGKANNLVGIVPISGHDAFDFEQPWPNCMMPIGPAYSLLEAAVVECAYAGCKSIWIVVNDDVGPLTIGTHDTIKVLCVVPPRILPSISDPRTQKDDIFVSKLLYNNARRVDQGRSLYFIHIWQRRVA